MKTRLTTKLAFALLLGLLLSAQTYAQRLTSLNTTAKGQGTISSNVDKHQISSVLVILKEDGTANFTFYTDLQLSAQGTWSAGSYRAINLKITGGIVSGNATGNGKLRLRPDKSIDKLTIQAVTAAGGKVSVEFVADKPASSTN